MEQKSNLIETNRFRDLKKSNLNKIEQNTIIELALDIMHSEYIREDKISKPEDVTRFAQLKYMSEKNEVFSIMYLDTRHRIIAWEDIAHGTIDGASIYPRIVISKVLERNAAKVILCHNHPSGDPTISQSDKWITKKLKDGLQHIDVDVLDHIIVGYEGVCSMAEEGYL